MAQHLTRDTLSNRNVFVPPVLLLGLVAALHASDARVHAQQPVRQPWMGVDASVAEIRVAPDLVTMLHRTSGIWPRPGEDWVTVHDLRGTQVVRVDPSAAVPDARMVNVQSAMATAGTLMVTAYVENRRQDSAHLLLRYDLPSGTLRRVARTDPMSCAHMAIDARSVWCFGGDAAKMDRLSQDFDLLHQFSHDGVLQRSALRWSLELPSSAYPAVHARSGAPVVTPVGGGVRVWIPKVMRLVSWRPGAAVQVSAIPPEIEPTSDARRQHVIDTGTAIVVAALTESDGEFTRTLLRWDGVSGVTPVPSAPMPSDVRILGVHDGRLVVWDRRGSYLALTDAPWLGNPITR